MGYDTHFQGKLSFSRELSAKEITQLKRFFDNPPRGLADIWTIHCDWATNGQKLFWNGSEKSYDMEKWLQIIIDRFLKPWGVELSGRMLARGERYPDVWTLEVKDGKAVKTTVNIPQDLGVTE